MSKKLKVSNVGSSESGKTICHACMATLKIGREKPKDDFEFTVIEMYDDNSDYSSYDVTFISDVPEGINEEELKKELITGFLEKD